MSETTEDKKDKGVDVLVGGWFTVSMLLWLAVAVAGFFQFGITVDGLSAVGLNALIFFSLVVFFARITDRRSDSDNAGAFRFFYFLNGMVGVLAVFHFGGLFVENSSWLREFVYFVLYGLISLFNFWYISKVKKYLLNTDR